MPTEEIKILTDIINSQQEEIFRLTNVIENLPGSIYWKNKEGVYLGRNTYAAQRMNQAKSYVIGKTDYDLFPKDIADEFRKNDLEVIEKDIELTKEEKSQLPNGDNHFQLSHKKPLKDSKGNIVGIIGNTIDITYLKLIEQELVIAKEKADELNHIKTDFIRNMEHDIRTPFNGIWGLSNYLWQKETDGDKKQLLGDITQSAKELLSYCNDVLDFSKLELGNLDILEQKFDLHKLMLSIVHMEIPAAKHKNLELNLLYDKHLPKEVIGDPYRLYRVLINLVSNAIKFTPVGSITLKAVFIKLLAKNCITINIEVRDTGPGIPPNQLKFIFEEFNQNTSINQDIYKGVGLGLVIVKKFIKELQGKIEIQNIPGRGCIFSFELPFKLPLEGEATEY
ncbi:MAG: putative Histidine kinase [Francisellaceae bacterium]|nr:putative Histidine kinase [Francisellaceae bacterium]